MHTINFHIKKISFKFLYDLSYTMSSLGIMLYIRDIHYSENIENKRLDKENSIGLIASSSGMNYFFIKSIKCLLSLPSFFGNRDDFAKPVTASKVKLFDSNYMLKLFDKIQSEDNKLFVLIIQNILLEQNQTKMTFKINEAFKFGLLKRPTERIHDKSIVSLEDNIISIINHDDMDRILSHPCYSELYNLYNIPGNKITNDKYKTKSCIELIIEKTPDLPNANHKGLYMYLQTLEDNYTKDRQKKIELMLFGQLMSMFRILREVLDANPYYKVDLSLGILFIEIPSSIFSYAYYIKNYILQGKTMISKAFQKRTNKNKFSLKENTPQSIMQELLNKQNEQNRFATEASGLEAHNNQLQKKKSKWYSRAATKASIKVMKDAVTSLISIDIPFTAIVFKQLDTNDTVIPFSYFVLIESEAKFNLADKDIAESVIQATISDIKWRSNDVRCKEMIVKKGNNKALKATLHPFKEINGSCPIISITLEAINLVFVFKCLKEMILFFEFNIKIFDENPSRTVMEDMKENKNPSKYIADIEIMNSAIILPEDSQSANYICINIDKGNIQVKIEDIVPKILLAAPQPQIIDQKAIFNAESIHPDENEFLKHIIANIEGSKLAAFFCINAKKEFLAEVNQLSLLFKQPFNDHDLTLLRKIEWEERYQTKVIAYKPSLEVKLNGQLKCALGNLLSMKQFMDNNFDEESKVLFLSEPNSMYNNIEMDFVFPTANFNMDLFKCFEDIATEDDVTRIGLQLIGNNKGINYDNEQPKKSEDRKSLPIVKNKFCHKGSHGISHSHSRSNSGGDDELISTHHQYKDEDAKTVEITSNKKKKNYFPQQDTVLQDTDTKIIEEPSTLPNQYTPEIVTQSYEFIPYQPVSVSSEMVGTTIEELLMHNFPTKGSWENSRLAHYPEEVIIRFNHRSHIKFVLLRAKVNRPIPHVDIFIGDGVMGNFNDSPYNKIASVNNVTEECSTIKVDGIGSFIRLLFTKGNLRSKDNPFGQVSLAQLKLFGKKVNHLIYYNDTKVEDTNNAKVDKVLIQLGLPINDTYNLVQDQNYEIAPVDEESKITIRDMLQIARRAEVSKDYEILRKIKEDIKLVFFIGNEILNYERQLTFAKSKDDYDTCIKLRQKLDLLIIRRDNIDLLYETTRYEKMILLKRPSTADRLAEEEYWNKLERERLELERLERERRQRERERLEREKQIRDDLLNRKNDSYQQDNNAKDKTTETVTINKREKQKKEEFNNDLKYNEGDKDLEPYFWPRAKAAGGIIQDPDLNRLRRALRQGILQVMGVRLFSGLIGDDWKMREAAVRAFLDFIENPILAKYANRTYPLFNTCIEICKLTSGDKVIEIYLEGLKILQTCLAPPVCGNDIDPAFIQKSVNYFLPIFIKKMSESNDKQRDMTFKTLIDIFRHPALNIGELIKACMDIVENNDGITGVTPDKQPWNILFTRLNIIYRVLDEYGIDDSLWSWYNVLIELIIPSLSHQKPDCRLIALEICVLLYKFVGSDIRNIINPFNVIKPDIKQALANRMNEIDISIKKESDTANRIQSGLRKSGQNDNLEPIIEADIDN